MVPTTLITYQTGWDSIIAGISTLVVLASGALVFNHEISLQDGITVFDWCVLPWWTGFVLHMIAVFRRRKKRKRHETGPSGESSG
jgi:hypothetical protein